MNVVILDTGCANLASVTYAVRRLGYQPEVSRDPEIVLRADKLFLPGVGTARRDGSTARARSIERLIKACAAGAGHLPRHAAAGGQQRRERRRDHARPHRYAGQADDRLRPAAAAHGLEPGVRAGGPPSVPRHR